MIKPNELRIGLYVMDVEPFDKVYQVDLNMIMNAVGNGYKYRGIPLTPEWLQKCGMTYSKQFKCYSKEFELLFDKEGDEFWLCDQDAVKGGLQ
jgi:hypothetical protein